MGPELIAAIVGPLVAGAMSVIIWQAKKNSDSIHSGLSSLHSCVHNVEEKVEGIQLDMAKNYCSRDELKAHIDKEEDWHDQHHQEVKELRQEFKDKTERLSHDVAEMKDMQWKIRMDQLDNRKRNI